MAMMRIAICDRCGAEIRYVGPTARLQNVFKKFKRIVIAETLVSADGYVNDRQYELCAECTEKLKKFLKGTRIKMKRLTYSGIAEARLDVTIKQVLDKLAEYEDLEEQGRLIKLPCKEAWFIVDRNTDFAMVMSKPIDDLCIYEIKGMDVMGFYWSTKEKAEQALQEREKRKWMR